MTSKEIQLKAGSVDELARFTAQQLHNMFPQHGLEFDVQQVESLCPAALARMSPILAAVRNFTPNVFNHFNALQYASFLYLLANESWQRHEKAEFPDRLFCLSRALGGLDLFYAVTMPEVFFISHGLGAVIGNANYGNSLVIFQNVTVGRVGDDRPIIGEDVVLYPNSSVTGRSVVGNRSVISANTHVHNATVPDDTVVFMHEGELVFKPRRKDYRALYFR